MTVIVRKKNKRNFYKLLIVLVIFLLLAVWGASAWMEFHQKQSQEFTLKTRLIERELKSAYEYADTTMRFLGNRIIKEMAADNAPALARLLAEQFSANEMALNFFYTTNTKWVTPKGEVRVEGRAVTKPPYPLLNEPSLKASLSSPWKLVIGEKTAMLPEGTQGLPVFMTISNGKEPLGALVSLINISYIEQKLDSQIGSLRVSFLVVDKAGNIVFHSSDNPDIALRKETQKIKAFTKEITANGVKHKSQLTVGPITYTDVYPLSFAPFSIFVGYHEKLAKEEWQKALLWNSTIFSILIALLAVLSGLWFLRYIMAEPTEKISKDLHQLLENEVQKGAKLQYLVSKEDMKKPLFESISRNQLMERDEIIAEAIRIIDEVDRARDWLSRELLQRLEAPTKAIISGLRLMKNEALGPLDSDQYARYVHQLYEAAQMLENYTSPLLAVQGVDVQEMLQKSIIMQRKDALKSRIRMELVIRKKIPLLWGDPLRLRQILVSTLYQSIAYLAPYRTITIAADYEKGKDDKPSMLIITIADNGLGFSLDAREGAKNPYLAPPKSFDFMKLDIPAIQYLIRLHQGSFEMITHCGVGTSFVIRLPYLSKESLELSLKEPENDWKALESLVRTKTKNIIPFPHRPEKE